MKSLSLVFATVALVLFAGFAQACPPVAVGGVVTAVPQAQFGYGMQQFAAVDPCFQQQAQFTQFAPQFAQQSMVYQQPMFQQQVAFAAPAQVVYQQPMFAQSSFSSFAVQQPVFAGGAVVQAHGRHARIASRRAIRRANRAARHGGAVVVSANGVILN